MFTPSCIATVTAKGFRSIYCHSDGWPGSVGRILLVHYNNVAQVRALLRLGNLSLLGEELGEKHDFDWSGKVPVAQIATDPRHRMCRAYSRDRGEKHCGAQFHRCFADIATAAQEDCTYWLYLWSGEHWLFAPVTPELTQGQLTILTEQSCKSQP